MSLHNFSGSLFLNLQRLCFIALLFAACFTASASAQIVINKSRKPNPEKEKATITDLENKWLGDLNSADVSAIAEILADDFMRPAPQSGTFVNKADLLSYYRSHLKPQAADTRRIEGMTVTLYGTIALARGTLTTTNPGSHATSKLLFTDVFVERDGKWQAISAQENQVTVPQTLGP